MRKTVLLVPAQTIIKKKKRSRFDHFETVRYKVYREKINPINLS